MPEENKPPVKETLPLEDDKPPVEKPPKKDDNPPEPSQADLDWRDNLSDDLKTDKSLHKFKTLDDLAKSYKEAERRLGQGLGNLDENASPADVAAQFKKVLGVKEESYKSEFEDEAIAKVYEEAGVHPKLAKSHLEKLQEAMGASEKLKSEKQQAEWKKELIKERGVDEANKSLLAGLDQMGMTWDDHANLHGSNALKPEVVKPILKLGDKAREDGVVKIREGSSTGGLPSDLTVLDQMSLELDRQRVEAALRGDSGRVSDIDKEIAKVKEKALAVSGRRVDKGLPV